MKKATVIFINAIPVLFMIGLIPLIANDYILAFVYMIIIIIALAVKKEKNDLVVLTFGLFAMIISEYFFVGTGVETFKRNSLLGVMPIWLPLLWGYGFVAIKRAVEILSH